MKAIQRVIYTGFAAVALASASMPVFPTVALAPADATLRGVDFEWYANVQVAFYNLGRGTLLAEAPPPPRAIIIERR